MAFVTLSALLLDVGTTRQTRGERHGCSLVRARDQRVCSGMREAAPSYRDPPRRATVSVGVRWVDRRGSLGGRPVSGVSRAREGRSALFHSLTATALGFSTNLANDGSSMPRVSYPKKEMSG